MRGMTFLPLIYIWSQMLAISGDITKYGFNERMKIGLEVLCPGVDICGGSGSALQSNEILDDNGVISCCHRCSCNKDCTANKNCCFNVTTVDDGVTAAAATSAPDTTTTTTSTTTTISTTTTTTTAPLAKKSLRMINTNSGGLVRTDRRATPGSMPFLDPRRRDFPGSIPLSPDVDVVTSSFECVYAQTGTADDVWPTTVPAYLMVTKPPQGGCRPNLNKAGAHRDVTASCEPQQFLTPWGSMFPVYSEEKNTIYLNEACARCHGQFDTTPWMALLVCDNYNLHEDRNIPFSEHFSFLGQNGGLPDACFVSFYSPNSTVMLDHRCFLDTVKTCSLSTEDDMLFRIPSEINLTKPEVVTACETGLNSPILFRNAVYQNVFCAICNRPFHLSKLLCDVDSTIARDFGAFKLTYLLDTSSIYPRPTGNETHTELSLLPTACLRDGSSWVEASCREVLCPSGQTRNSDGDCEFPSKRWFGAVFAIFVQLQSEMGARELKDLSEALDRLDQGNIDSNSRLGGLENTCPWPTYWNIVRLLRPGSNAGVTGEPQLVIELHTDITRPEVITEDLRQSMSKPWILVIDGKRFEFKQAFLEYTLRFNFGFTSITPWWAYYANASMVGTPSSNWSMLFLAGDTGVPYQVSKLLTCEQVALHDGEYSLMAYKFVIKSNVTKRPAMLDLEFDLVRSGNGKLTPRVCLEDTRLVVKSKSNDAPNLYQGYLTLIMLLTIVMVI